MQCKDLAHVLESEGLGTLSAEAREHLASCLDCQGLLADFHSIVAVARTIPAEVEPPARVWISLRARLEAEGLIKEPVEVMESASWWESVRAVFRPRSLAGATAGLLLVATTVYMTRRPSSVPQAPQPVAVQAPSAPGPQTPANFGASPWAPPATAAVATRTHTPAALPSKVKELAPSPSEMASSTLSQAEMDLPDMQLAGNSRVDASLRENLKTLNEFIAECEQHLKQNPQDQLAREYLYTAYQQKADLLAAMMESGRSEH
jgi:ribosomal protein S15P/S13E